jgi:chromosome partitioning protein
MRIAVWNSKGGSGKTTMAVCIAGELARRGRSVLVLDLDEQGSALRWSESRESGGVSVVGAREGFAAGIDRLTANFDAVVMDTPGRETRAGLEAIMVADLALIPLSATPADVLATAEALETVKRAQTYRPQLAARLVLTRLDRRTSYSRQAADVLRQTGVEVASASLASRLAFASVVATGDAPTVTEPESKAAAELRELIDELESIYAQSTAATAAE